MKTNKITSAHPIERSREELLRDDSLLIGLDDTFQFRCTQCGKCCRNRNAGDIILSPRDIYSMSKDLNMEPTAFINAHCVSTIGSHSRVPLLLFKPVGSDKHCPLLKNNQCSVHTAKPTTCALYPLGRRFATDDEDAIIEYILQPIQCGRKPKTYTVRQWLEGFGMDPEDECYIKWAKAFSQLTPLLQKLEAEEDPLTVHMIQGFTRFVLYELYEMEKPFLEQFENNLAEMLQMLSDIPSLKAVMREYGVELPEINIASLNWGKPGSGYLGCAKFPILRTEHSAKK